MAFLTFKVLCRSADSTRTVRALMEKEGTRWGSRSSDGGAQSGHAGEGVPETGPEEKLASATQKALLALGARCTLGDTEKLTIGKRRFKVTPKEARGQARGLGLAGPQGACSGPAWVCSECGHPPLGRGSPGAGSPGWLGRQGHRVGGSLK